MFKKILLGSACLLAFGTFAHANTITTEIFNLNTSADLGNFSAGTIKLVQDSDKLGEVDVTVALNQNYSFRTNSDGNHSGFVFNLDSSVISTAAGSVTATNFTPGFALQNGGIGKTLAGTLPGAVGSFGDTPYGSFGYDFECSSLICSNGPTPSSDDVTTLQFDLLASGLTVDSFTNFAADLQEFANTNHKAGTGAITIGGDVTRTVTTFADPTPVPEPSSLVLLGSGLAGAAGFARRKFVKA